MIIFFGLVGAALGYFGAKTGLDLFVRVPGAKWLVLVALASTPLAWMIAVGFHELGHLVGGWLTGGRFLLWSVGPFMLRRTPSGIRFNWNRSFNTAGGLGACLPLDPERMTPQRTAVMILGGPVSSLVLLVAMLWLALVLTNPRGAASVPMALAQNFAILTAGMSGLIFLVTAFPSAVAGMKSDGKRVFELMRGDRRSDQEAAMLMLTSASLAGIRPSKWPESLIRRSTALGDGSLFDFYGHFNAYYAAADSGRWPEAQAHLDYMLRGEHLMVPYVRDVARSEYAWLLATQGGDPAVARAWLETAGPVDFDPAARLRAEAAVLLAEGRLEECAARAKDALHALEHRSLSPTRSAFAVEAVEAILQQTTGMGASSAE